MEKPAISGRSKAMEIKVNKDLRKFKSPDIWLFSWKEFVYVIVGLVICAISIVIQKKTLGAWTLEAAAFPAVPVWVFGFLKIQGLSIPEYIKQVFPEKFLIPRSLKWESDFEYDPYTARDAYDDDDIELIPMQRTQSASSAPKKKGRKKKKR